ncbi:MAG: linear amide C-N hydrolase [Calditrichaeota bacterium]|nr:linear amide C-N hydrolase [Calditrichota bacterium]
MSNIFRIIVFLFVTLNIASSQVLKGCTAFCLKKENTILVGKNLDWPVGDGFIIINKRSVAKFAMVKPDEKQVHWVSKYGSVTFNQFGEEFPLGGMNEAGLVVEELSYSPAVYPANESKYSLNELQWIQYQLDNYCTVGEVIRNLDSLCISELLFGLHYFICDRSGDAAVIEFIEGKIFCYDGDDLPVPEVSNNSYHNSLKYLKLHQGFGGDRIPTNGPESPERFVRAAGLLQNFQNAQKMAPEDYAFGILKNVKQHDTQWSIIYDPQKLKIHFQLRDQRERQKLDYETINFSEQSGKDFFILGQNCEESDLIQYFVSISANENLGLLETVFNKLVKLDEMDEIAAHQLMEKFSEYYQKLINDE